MAKILRNTFILIVICLVVYGIIGLFNSSKPPSPTITVGDIKIATAQGTYCWNGFMNSMCVDMISPPEIVAHKKLKVVVVSPEAKLEIGYKNKPKKGTLDANIWINIKAKNVDLKGDVLTAPSEKGVYVYDIHARWEKGSSSNVFGIEVR